MNRRTWRRLMSNTMVGLMVAAVVVAVLPSPSRLRRLATITASAYVPSAM